MAFRHILLGTLMDLPTHGYDMIKKCFSDFTPADPKMNEGRLYSTLKALDKEGLVERSVRRQEDVPDQKVVSITSRGTEEFYRWLESDQDEEGHAKFDFFTQYPFLTKVNFFKFLPEERIKEKLLEQLHISGMRLDRFYQAQEEMVHKKVDGYRIRILQYGIEVEKIRSAWLRDTLAEIGEDE
ncbi:MAG TPA: PadR family transcriptional regulator [Syntrophomonadaceae bacterium]|jgi:DNA-binding PadR family transcriptional regulator|nr:PadR family transcriptional regulator [Syntrophomonadaceae bacterium]